jgi:glycosyltransferase involved in cell wall biosynthesis
MTTKQALVVGSMNCMPTEYAIMLTRHFDRVVHFYDAGRHDSLSNPRIRWGAKSAQRTQGIELRKLLFRHYVWFLLPQLFHRRLIRQIRESDLVLLSGPAISLARLVPAGTRRIIALSYGGDISIFCSRHWPSAAPARARNWRGRIASKLGWLKARFVDAQVAGLRSCTHYSYFIEGLDVKTDALIEEVLAGSGPKVRLPRYSIGLDILEHTPDPAVLRQHAGRYKILFPVRFCDDELFGDKGWRLLFDGLKQFREISSRPFVCVCFEKGDHRVARDYAAAIGVADLLEWRAVVPFDTLVDHYHAADVVVEQLGSHWIAQGLFAMALGKPVIGRLTTDAQHAFFHDSGLLAVHDEASLVDALVRCQSAELRERIGAQSRAFVPARAAIAPEFERWGVV